MSRIPQQLTMAVIIGNRGFFPSYLVLDYMAAGIDPNKTMIFTHSAVPSVSWDLLKSLTMDSRVLPSASEKPCHIVIRHEIVTFLFILEIWGNAGDDFFIYIRW